MQHLDLKTCDPLEFRVWGLGIRVEDFGFALLYPEAPHLTATYCFLPGAKPHDSSGPYLS